ncbi:hypothetical protein UPYG_G00130890 [Umbra pygmaea]|uniref:Pentraxin family member n=1 Tax=Umbra pygmaea TaxID=75934 RepID=A0ABD0WTE6_UMBPY
MEKLILFISLMVCCLAEKKDLSGKMFTFPVDSDTIYVKLKPDLTKTFLTTTVCMRYFTDLQRSYSLFSLASPSADNNLLLWNEKNGPFNVWVAQNHVSFYGMNNELNSWNSLCATWDSRTGIGQLWLNGKPSNRKSVSPGSTSLTGDLSIVLGQEQDSYEGSFDTKQSFVGSITDVYMWDTVLPSKNIQYYMHNEIYRPTEYDSMSKPGNVLNWVSLDFTTHGSVVVEDKIM